MKRLISVLAISLFLFSCSNNSKTILIWSDRREMADIAELYNKSGTENRVVFQYREDLVASFFNEDVRPDILIGKELNNDTVKSELAALSTLLKNEREDWSESPLFSGTDFEKETRLLPLSYSPLILTYLKSSNGSISINAEEVLAISSDFNGKNRKGYSPYWDKIFLQALLDLKGVSFQSGGDVFLQWNNEKLSDSIQFLRRWEESNGGKDEMDGFNSKYLYDNRIKLQKEERILFSSSYLGDFMILSDSMNRQLDFSYLTLNSRIHPGEVVYAGIYRRTDNYEQSARFLSWILEKENQEMIVRSSRENNLGTFGLLGGLSSFDEVNRDIMSLHYPRLTGKVPLSDYLLGQPSKPVEYDKVRDELIAPWLYDIRDGDDISLDEALSKWEKLRIPF